ncbi:MAG: restriction endonuclease subunit S [Bacteroidia bacterium]|nr:restriction endonuclease subunit S [Bacteroidia bacterium]
MKQGWEIKKLGEVCDFQNGFAFQSKTYKESGLPILRITNIQNDEIDTKELVFFDIKDYKVNLDRFKVYQGDLLIAMSGATTGKLGINNSETVFYLNQRVGKFIPKKQLNKSFLYYFLTTKVEESLRIAAGAAQPNLSTEQINNFQIPLPPLPEQQRIVSILDDCFAAIDKAKTNAEQNLKNAKELFESYLQGVFENGSWETKKWGELCDFVRGPFGGSLKKNVFKDSGYVVYEQKHAIHDHFNQLRYFIDEEKFNEMKRFELFPGDIIMSCSGVTLGRVAVVPDGIPKGIINQALLKLTPKKNVSVHFIKYWLRSNIFQKIIFDYSGGAAIPNVPSAKILKDIKIPCPSLKEQERIVNEIETVLNESKRLENIYEQKIADLEELKKSILQKVFSGELKTEKAVAV